MNVFGPLSRVLIGVSILSVVVLALGWPLGFQSGGAYFVFWLFSASVGMSAAALGRRFFPWEDAADAIIRCALIALALVVLSGLLLGSVGRLTPETEGLLLVVVLLASVWSAVWSRASAAVSLPPGAPGKPVAALPPVAATRLAASSMPLTATGPLAAVVPIAAVAAVATMCVFVVAYGTSHSPLTAYDSLSYHLYFPARWLQEHRLSIIATPFSDEAQAYAPANGELYFLWLMLPFHGDLLARIGQVPFYLLNAVLLYALARRAGAAPDHAIYPAAFYMLSRPVIDQAVGADVDLVCWALFLCALHVGVAAVDSDARRDWILWGVALGLCLGSKFVALVYLPVLLPLPFIRRVRPKALWALPGLTLFALPWYLRNWVIAGSPIYPSSVTIAGLTIARGAFTRAAMLNSVFHLVRFSLFPVVASRAFGPPLAFLWLPFALLGFWGLVTRSRGNWFPGRYLLVVPWLMIPLDWFGIPDNVDERFLLPAAALALVPLAFAFRTSRVWNACLHALYAAGLAWLVVGANAVIPLGHLPWPMENGLFLDGPLDPRYGVLFLALAAVITVVWAGSRRGRAALPSLAALTGVAAAALAAGAVTWCAPAPCDFLRIAPTNIRPPTLEAWAWVAGQTHDATFAYTGSNVPYPLFGEHLTNRVYYVNIDHHLDWRLHDYDRAFRRRRENEAPGGPVSPVVRLATSSGELRPATPHPDGRVDASRPRYERMEGYREGWLDNLRRLGVDHLFISSLTADELDYVWHNAGGFPIEDEWAKADPGSFHVAYENQRARIYEVTLR